MEASPTPLAVEVEVEEASWRGEVEVKTPFQDLILLQTPYFLPTEEDEEGEADQEEG